MENTLLGQLKARKKDTLERLNEARNGALSAEEAYKLVCLESELSKKIEQIEQISLASDVVHSPGHYTVGGIETIDFMKAKAVSKETFLDYCRLSVLKYLTRAPFKNNEIEDMKKARWYLDRWLAEAENGE